MAAATSRDEIIDESIHYCFLELNAWRELDAFAVDIGDKYFGDVPVIIKNLIQYVSDDNICHVIHELSDYLQECLEVHSEKREKLATETLENLQNSVSIKDGYDIPGKIKY